MGDDLPLSPSSSKEKYLENYDNFFLNMLCSTYVCNQSCTNLSQSLRYTALTSLHILCVAYTSLRGSYTYNMDIEIPPFVTRCSSLL